MNALTRIHFALRETVAETKIAAYLTTTGLGLALLAILTYAYFSGGQIDYWEVPPDGLLLLLVVLGFLPAFGISVSFFTSRLKDRGRVEHFLSLPLSNRERFGVSMAYHAVIVPLITFGPLLVLAVLLSLVGPAWIMWPAFRYWGAPVLLSLGIYYSCLIFWLFPAVATPRYLFVAILALIGLSVGATFLLYSVFGEPFYDFAVDGSIFSDPTVVGMHEVARYAKERPVSEMALPTESESFSGWSTLVAAPLLLLATYRALTNKQA